MDPTPNDPGAPARPRRRRRILWGVLIPVAIVAALVLTVRWTSFAESMAFYVPSREAFKTPAGYEDVNFTTTDGVHLHGWLMPARGAKPGEKRPAILHLHGNAGNIDTHAEFSSFLADDGFHVLIFDYRGYGRSDPARMLRRGQLLTDSRAALACLLSRPDVDTSHIGVYGVSLGGVFATALAAESPQVRAICTVSAFSSWSRIAGDHVPILGPLLMPTGLDPIDSVTRLGGRPYLIIHGDNDDIVPAAHAARLETAARGAGVTVTRTMISGADHNAIIADHPAASGAITAFFSRHLRPAP